MDQNGLPVGAFVALDVWGLNNDIGAGSPMTHKRTNYGLSMDWTFWQGEARDTEPVLSPSPLFLFPRALAVLIFQCPKGHVTFPSSAAQSGRKTYSRTSLSSLV